MSRGANSLSAIYRCWSRCGAASLFGGNCCGMQERGGGDVEDFIRSRNSKSTKKTLAWSPVMEPRKTRVGGEISTTETLRPCILLRTPLGDFERVVFQFGVQTQSVNLLNATK